MFSSGFPYPLGDGGEDNTEDQVNGNNWAGRNGHVNRLSMQVPDRIIVTGQDTHLGTKAIPRELQLESMVMPADPEIVKIQTPPRTITLMDRSVDTTSNDGEDDTLVVEHNRARFAPDRSSKGSVTPYASADTSLVLRHRASSFGGNGEGDGGGHEVMTEIEHLREQLSRMNRRVLAVEEDSQERREREKYFVMAGILYVAYQAMSWLFRSSNQR